MMSKREQKIFVIAMGVLVIFAFFYIPQSNSLFGSFFRIFFRTKLGWSIRKKYCEKFNPNNPPRRTRNKMPCKSWKVRCNNRSSVFYSRKWTWKRVKLWPSGQDSTFNLWSLKGRKIKTGNSYTKNPN